MTIVLFAVVPNMSTPARALRKGLKHCAMRRTRICAHHSNCAVWLVPSGSQRIGALIKSRCLTALRTHAVLFPRSPSTFELWKYVFVISIASYWGQRICSDVYRA